MDEPVKLVYLGTHKSMFDHAQEHGYDPRKVVYVVNSSTLHGLRDVDVLFCQTWYTLPNQSRSGVMQQLSTIGIRSWQDLC